MKLEKGIISNQQLIFMVFSFLQISVLTINFTSSLSKQDTWLAVLISFVIAILFALIYLTISKKYPGKNLVQINDAVFGGYLGKLISVIYIWFFFQCIIHYMYFFNSFWITFIMQETPRYVFLIMGGIVCAIAVRSGIEVIARCGLIFSATVVLATVLVTTLSIPDMELSNLLPAFKVSLKDFVQSVHILSAIAFGDVVAFMMIFAYVADKKKLKKPVLIGMSLGAIQLMIVTLRDIVVLGPNLAYSSSASFTVSRQIDIADILTRMDILVAIGLMVGAFVKILIFYYVTVLGAAQILKLRSYKPIVIPIGAIAVAIAAVLYPSDMEQVYAAKYAWPFNASVCEFILPAITVIVMAIRSLREKLTGLAGVEKQ